MKNKVLTANILKGLEAMAKINKGMGKLNPDTVSISIAAGSMTVTSIKTENQAILTIPVDNTIDFESGVLELDKMIKGLKKFSTYTSFEMADNNIMITDGKKSIKLSLTESIQKIQFEHNSPFTIDGVILEAAYKKVKKSVAKEESRPILCGVHFKNNFIESVDGYRISQVEVMDSYMDHDMVMRVSGLDLIVPLAKKDKAPVQIDANKEMAKMTINTEGYNLAIITDLLQGDFLKTDSVFTNDFVYTMGLDGNKDIVNEVDFIKDMLVDAGAKNPIIFEVGNSNLVMRDTKKTIETQTEVQVEYSQKNKMDIAFNPIYVLDALKSIDDSNFTINFNTCLAPMVIKNKKEKYLVLPVRLPA